MNLNFKNNFTLKQRKEESTRVISKYPYRIPIICEKMLGKNIPDIDKHKYLVPVDLTMGQFIYVIRNRIKLNNQQALFLFINGTIPSSNSLMINSYSQLKDEDGFLYINYSSENTFG